MKTIREIGTDILHEVLENGAYANLQLKKALASLEYSRDRAFLTNLVYGSIHRLTPVDYQLARFLTKPVKAKDIYLKTILRTALFELLFTAAKEHAVVNEYVNLGKKRGNPGWAKMINGILRNVLRQKSTLVWPEFSDEGMKTAFYYSIPSWLVSLWQKERGEEVASQLLASMTYEPTPVLRANTLKTDREKLQKKLAEKNIDTVQGTLSPDALRLVQGTDIDRIPKTWQPYYTVQEESSQLVSFVLDPQPEDRVLDMCAAPGGKTTHLAQRMKNEGTILASDLYEHKVALIRDNAKRLGITMIEAVQKDGTAWGKECPRQFDKILLDAPCSGLGVFHRRADSRLRKNSGDIEALASLQRELLDSAYQCLKPGGYLLYSTCTLSNAENRGNLGWFLDTYSDMKSVDFSLRLHGLTDIEADQARKGYLELLPYIHHTDGFFISLMKKDSL